MAVKVSIATGDFTNAATWATVDATSYLNDENVTESLLTTAYSGTRSSAFTPGGITVSHLGVKLCERIGTTGTMSVSLRNSTLGLDDFVTGTEVTINTADLPSALEADLNGGWIFFKLATPVLLLVANAYNIQAKTSSTNQVDLWCNSTGDNISRCLVTTTSAAPGAGDDLIIAGEKTGSGTENNFIVTMDETATTDYGAASTSLITPAIAICDGGILRNGVTAATPYNLRVSGNIIVYSGGEFDLGTTGGGEMPRDSSMTLLFDCASNVDFGLTVRNLGTFISQGLSRTISKNIVSCKLNTDEAIAQTTLGVDTDTGWLDNDVIAVASTTRTQSNSEIGALNGDAGASSLTVDGFGGAGGGLAVAHSGTSPTQAEVILLTRNVKILGTSATLQAYVDLKATATVDCDWTEFQWLGSGTTLKRGIVTACTTGIQSFQYCSFHNFEVTNSIGFQMNGASGTGLTYSNNVTYLINIQHFINVNSTGSSIIDSNIFMLNSSGDLVLLTDLGGTFTNNTIISASSTGLSLAEVAAIGTFNNITVHSCNNGVVHANNLNGTIDTITIWRCASSGYIPTGGNLTISNLTAFGNSSNNISFGLIGLRLILISPVLNGDTTFSTTSGIGISGTANAAIELIIYNGNFGTVTGIKTAHTQDINISGQPSLCRIFLNNTLLASATEIATPSNLSDPGSFISSQKHNQTAGVHKTLKKYGTIIIDTGTVHTGSQSCKMTPNNSSFKLEAGSFFIAVANGSTLTPTVFVYEDASYNGNRARLIVKRNDAIGISADTVLDTATISSDENWEGLTGTTVAATDDGVMEFVVDCDGTAGNLFIDSFSVV